MKYILAIFGLIFITSCSLDSGNSNTPKIEELTKKIEKIEKENEVLKTEINSLKNQVSAQYPATVGEVTGMGAPKDMQYKEVSNDACFKKAQDEYVTLGNQQCKQMGYSEEDIKNKKCKLTREFIDVLQKKLQDATIACGPGQ